MKHFILFVVFALVRSSVRGAEFNIVSSEPSTVPITTPEAAYQCEFVNLWSAERHPEAYPEDAHWSPPVLASHTTMYTMWKPGVLATPGVENVAETGSTATLLSEISAAGTATLDPVDGVVQFNRDRQTQTLPAVLVDASHYLLSAITMIAPSPDWFSGFYDLDVRDPNNRDNFLQSFSVETYPWDAGTEQGDTFSGANDAENPAKGIFQLIVGAVPATGVLLNPDGTAVLPMVRWDCELVAEEGGSVDAGILESIVALIFFCI